MFTWLNKQGVKSDKGFIVQRTGRFSSEYVDGTNKITIFHESGYFANTPALLVNASEFSRWDDGSLIPISKQKEIIKNFCEAIKFQDLEVVVD